VARSLFRTRRWEMLLCRKVNAASAARGDTNGSGILPGMPPGTYYLMISTRYNNQALIWEQAVQLKAGQNSLKLDPSNATLY
jgi:hypothetical protein